MPTYEYQCDKCRHRFAVTEPMSKHGARAPACPRCKSRSTRQLTSAFFAKTIRKS